MATFNLISPWPGVLFLPLNVSGKFLNMCSSLSVIQVVLVVLLEVDHLLEEVNIFSDDLLKVTKSSESSLGALFQISIRYFLQEFELSIGHSQDSEIKEEPHYLV